MDKQTFYTELASRLDTLGVSREYIERHLKQFDSYFDGKNEEEIHGEIERLGDLDRVAARIKRMTDKIIDQEAEGSSDSKEEEKTEASDTVSEVEAATEAVAAEPPAAPISEEAVDAPASDAETENDSAENVPDDDVITFTPVSRDAVYSEKAEEAPAEEDAVPVYEGRKRGEAAISDGEEKDEPFNDTELKKRAVIFWLVFALTLPFTLSICAVTAAAFAIVFFVIAILIIALVALLVGITAAATLVSVFGIIFGVAQMLTSLPIGLYECGLAVVFGSLSMFVGILIYNVAVRLLPFAAKWLLVFLKFVFRKFKQLFIYVKKECIGL